MLFDVFDCVEYLSYSAILLKQQHRGPHHGYHAPPTLVERVPAREIVCLGRHQEVVICVEQLFQIVRETEVVDVHDQRGVIGRQLVGQVPVHVVPCSPIQFVAQFWFYELVVYESHWRHFFIGAKICDHCYLPADVPLERADATLQYLVIPCVFSVKTEKQYTPGHHASFLVNVLCI